MAIQAKLPTFFDNFFKKREEEKLLLASLVERANKALVEPAKEKADQFAGLFQSPQVQEGIKRVKETPLKEYFLPTATQAEPFREYIKQTAESAKQTAISGAKLTPPYQFFRAVKGKPITPQEQLENAANTVLSGLHTAYRLWPGAPLLGVTTSTLKGIREYNQGKITAEELAQRPMKGITEQPGIGAVFSDNPKLQTAIDLAFMATMITQPFWSKKLGQLNLKAKELNKVSETLGVNPNTPMTEVNDLWKRQMVQFKDVFAGKGTPEQIRIVKELNEAQGILEKAGVIDKNYANFLKVLNDQSGFIRLGGEPKVKAPTLALPTTEPGLKVQEVKPAKPIEQTMFRDQGKASPAEMEKMFEKKALEKYQSTKTLEGTPLAGEMEKAINREQMGGGLFAKEPTPEEIAQSEERALAEAKGEVKTQEATLPYAEEIQKFKNFLRIAGEKKGIESGELFREHIPRSVFGVSSDEVSAALGKSENEFMSGLMEDITVFEKSPSTTVATRISNKIKKIKDVGEALKLDKTFFKVVTDMEGKLATIPSYKNLKPYQPAVSIGVTPTEETLGKIEKGKEKAELKTRQQLDDEWQRAIRAETLTPAQNLKRTTDMVKQSTDDAIKEKLESMAEKTFLIDIRTPELVFKKLGIHDKVYMPLRRGQEGLTKKIVEEVGIMNDWYKRAGKSQAQRDKIGSVLDGLELPGILNPQELKVYQEVKARYAELAELFGVPKENQITNYLTHIFDKDFEKGKKTIPQELARVLDFVNPGKIFNPYLEERTGAKGYKLDFLAAYDAYARRGWRKVLLDGPIENATKYADAEGEQAQKYLDAYIKNFIGRPDKTETWLEDNLLGGLSPEIKAKLGSRPFKRLSDSLRTQVYRSTLGLNFKAAARNSLQNVNTLAEMGEARFTQGVVDLLTKGTNELIEQGVLEDMIIADYQAKPLRDAMRKVDKGLFFAFETVERFNRGVAYYAGKRVGLSKGMTEEEAIDFAKAKVRKTQFAYGKLDMPLLLQSTVGKVGFQYSSYPIKQAELLEGWLRKEGWSGKGKLLHYVFYALLVPVTIGKTMGIKFSDMFNLLPGLGPIPDAMIAVYRAAMGDWRGERDIKQIPWLAVPGGIPLKRTIDAAKMIKEGGSYTATGKLRFKAPETTAGKLGALLLGQYSTKEAQPYIKQLEESNPSLFDRLFKKKEEETDLLKKYNLKKKTKGSSSSSGSSGSSLKDIKSKYNLK